MTDLSNLKLSAIIDLSLDDLELVEQDNNYEVDMDTWHEPRGTTVVCLAGAVMAKTLRVPKDELALPKYFGQNQSALVALDHARLGYVGAALGLIGSPFRDDLDRIITPYAESPAKFKRDMRKLSEDLKREGL